MAQYIDKSILVAELERGIKERDSKIKRGSWVTSTFLFEDLLDFIDTLEVKDVNLEEEIDNWYNTMCVPVTTNALKETAKHFFELGFKAQKGE